MQITMIPDAITYHDQIPKESLDSIGQSYDHGTFFSKEPTLKWTVETYDIIEKTNKLVKICKVLIRPQYLLIHNGYESVFLLYAYPGKKRDPEYNPVTREWYYSVYNEPENIVIGTFPYPSSSTGKFLLSESKRIIVDNETIGVSSIDYSLAQLNNMLDNIELPGQGFLMLITKSGLMINKPHDWAKFSFDTRFYDNYQTGVYEDPTWTQQIDNDEWPNDKLFRFTAFDEKIYFGLRFPIIDRGVAKYYLIAVLPQSQIDDQVDHSEELFSESYWAIFWVAVAVACFFFSFMTHQILKTGHTFKSYFELISTFLGRVCRNSVFQGHMAKVDGTELAKSKSSLMNCVLAKVDMLINLDDHYDVDIWISTRPSEQMIFYNYKFLYPLSVLSGKVMPWKTSVEQVKNERVKRKRKELQVVPQKRQQRPAKQEERRNKREESKKKTREERKTRGKVNKTREKSPRKKRDASPKKPDDYGKQQENGRTNAQSGLGRINKRSGQREEVMNGVKKNGANGANRVQFN